jgi:hypothetical protein
MMGWDAKCPAFKSNPREMFVKTLMSALAAMAVLAGIAVPASAAALDGCPSGYDQAYDTCVRVLP